MKQRGLGFRILAEVKCEEPHALSTPDSVVGANRLAVAPGLAMHELGVLALENLRPLWA